MSKEIGLPDPVFVVNKVKGPGDESFALRGPPARRRRKVVRRPRS